MTVPSPFSQIQFVLRRPPSLFISLNLALSAKIALLWKQTVLFLLWNASYLLLNNILVSSRNVIYITDQRTQEQNNGGASQRSSRAGGAECASAWGGRGRESRESGVLPSPAASGSGAVGVSLQHSHSRCGPGVTRRCLKSPKGDVLLSQASGLTHPTRPGCKPRNSGRTLGSHTLALGRASSAWAGGALLRESRAFRNYQGFFSPGAIMHSPSEDGL